jgi:hypothetical protein
MTPCGPARGLPGVDGYRYRAPRREGAAVTMLVQQPAPEAPTVALELRGRTRVWRVALMVLGGAAGFAIVWTHPERGREDWYAWAALGTLLGGLAGSSFGSGIARYCEITTLQRVRFARAAPPLLLMALVAGAALPLSVVILGHGVIGQGMAMAGLAIVGALPAGAAVVAIRVLAIDGVAGSVGRRLGTLLRLRRLLSRLNTIFGSLVVALTLFNAAGFRPPVSVVIYTGAASAVVVALVYLPTAAVLRRRCLRFIDEEFPLDGVDRAALIQAADDRNRLEGILGLHRTTLAELQNALVIVSPLLASAGVTLLPGF